MRHLGGFGWVGQARSPPQIFSYLLVFMGYPQNFHMSCQKKVTDIFATFYATTPIEICGGAKKEIEQIAEKEESKEEESVPPYIQL